MLRRLRTRVRRLPVATKITLTLTAILALMSGAGIAATVHTVRLSADVRQLASDDFPLLRASYELETLGGEIAATTAVYVTTGDVEALTTQRLRRREFAAELRALRGLADSFIAPLDLDSIEALATRLDSAAQAMVGIGIPAGGQAVEADSEARAASIQQRTAGIQAAIVAIARLRIELSERLKEDVRAPAEREVELVLNRASLRNEAQVAVTAGLLILALLISAAAAERLSDDINDPLRKLVRAAARLSAGRLRQPVQVDSSHEFNSLATAFNRMAERLDTTLREVKDAAARAEAASSAKSVFVSEVSHELRTPLTSLKGSLILLARGAVEPASQTGERMLQVALSSTERLIRLINDRLDIDRIEAGELSLSLESLDPSLVVQDALANISTLAEDRHVAIEVRGDSPAWLGDHDRVVQVLVNLIANAVSFSPDGKTVTLDLSSAGDIARVEIRDEGPGIDQNQQQTVFRPFTQAHKRRPGSTGLGLAIAQGIIREHGGEIGLESQPGQGATFWFTLPLADATAPVWHRRVNPLSFAQPAA